MIVLTEPAHAEDYLHRLRAVPTLLATTAARASAGTARRTHGGRTPRPARCRPDRPLPRRPRWRPVPRPGAAGRLGRCRRVHRRAPAHPGRRGAPRHGGLPRHPPRGRPAARPRVRPAGADVAAGRRRSYAALVRLHTTTTRTPAEIHQLGLDIIAGLAREYAEVGGRLYGTVRARRDLPAHPHRPDAAVPGRRRDPHPRRVGRAPGRGRRARVVRPAAGAAVHRQGRARRPGPAGSGRLLLPAGARRLPQRRLLRQHLRPRAAAAPRERGHCVPRGGARPPLPAQPDPGAVPLAAAQGLHGHGLHRGMGPLRGAARRRDGPLLR